ncbi:unnamed protein product [Schistosoma spindalis]|nr:unnamed protein product [Schistosoma spindale]
MLEYPSCPFSPSMSEIQQVKRDEIERRKRLRILQVRMQAKRNATKVRMLYNAKKQQLSDVIAKDLQIKHVREDMKLLEAKKDEYCNVINQYGIGHRSAENWNDPTLDTYWNLSVAQKRAKDRFNIAVDKLHREKLIQDIAQHETQERIKEVRNTEKKRAALIASLPPPKGILSEEILKPSFACEPLVLVYDIEARNTVHTQNVQSKVVVKNNKVDEEKDIGPQSAAISACKEEQRIQAVERENAIHAREDLIKADMRGRQAMRKERVRQYYQDLLNRLDEVKRNETSLRRSQLYSGTVESSHVPGGGPFNDAVLNRRMEKVFEAELLYQLSNVNREEYIDVIEENTLEKVNNNNNDMNGYNEVLDMESEQESISVKDAKLTNDSNLIEQPMSLSNYRVLDFDQDINDEISHHDEHLSMEEEELMPDEKKSVNSTDLGPGERPILPDIRRCRILSESISFTNSIHNNINPNKTFKPVHGNSKISPQSVALSSKTSFEDKSTSDICTDNENIQLRQKLLDEELDMIDKRINRLRLNSACDLHENQSHSAKLSKKDLKESTQINDNITPRNMYIVEGCVCGDNGVSDRKDFSNLPINLLNTEPKTGETPSLSLKSQPTTTVALDVFSSKSTAVAQKISTSMASNNQSSYNTESTVVKYCISKPITGVLAERARDLIRIQKAKLLNLEKYKPTTELSQSLHTSNQSSVDMDSEIFTNSSATNMEISENEDVSCFSPDASKQIMNYCSITNNGKHSSGWRTNDDKQSFEFSLQKNINVYESSIPSTETPVIVNKSVQPPKSQYDDDAYNKSHSSEIVIFDDVAQDVSKTPDHDSCFETVSCIKNLNKMNYESYKDPHELNTTEISNEKNQKLELKIPFQSSPSDPPIKISSQPTHFVDLPAMHNLSTLQLPSSSLSSSSSSSTLSPQSSMNSPSSIGSKQTMPPLSSSDKPQSLESYTTSDTLKAELKALLTSSLITSIISHNSSVTTDTNDLKKLFSSQSYILSSLSGIYRNAKTQTTEISSEIELPYPTTSISSISSLNPSQLSSSPKNAQLKKLSDNTSNDQQSNENTTERPLCDGHADNQSIDSNYSNKLTVNSDFIKTTKQRILNKYINTNKEWLVTLSGLNNGKLLQTHSSSSSSKSSVEFHCLSEVTDHKEIDWCETRSDSSSLRSKQFSISKSPEIHEHFSSPQTHSPLSMIYSARFKPLPRLEEATSEESVHTVQVTSDFNNLSNTPSSWTDSRKSSEFGNLSIYSTINSSTTYIPDNSVKNKNTNSSIQNVLNNEVYSYHLSEDNDTIKQLLDNIPNTPIESNNNGIVPCLGSKLSSTSLSKKSDNGTLNAQEFDLKIVPCTIPVDDQRNNVTTSETPIIINPISSDNITVENLSENSRPSSPAEGAVSKFSPSYHQNVKFNVSASLPSVFVESMDGCEKYQKQTETSHYSSNNNLKTFMQTNETSLTDSLLSFERHEVRCDLLSNSGTFAAGGLKSQFPDTLSNNVDAKNVSSPTDNLNNKKTTEKPTLTYNKCLVSKNTIKDCMYNQCGRIHSNRVAVKTSNTKKLDSFVCNSSKQRTTRSGIVQSIATNGQRSIKTKPSNVIIPSSTTQITHKSSLKSTNVTNSFVNNKRLPSIPVCTSNSTRLSRKQIKTSESYNCTKLNPFNQAKVLQMELIQWQQKRLKCYHESCNSKMAISTNTVIPKTNTNCISIDVDNNIPLISDDNVDNIINLKNIPGSIQIKSDQQPIENNQSSPSSDNVNQTSVDLTMVNKDQPVVSCLPGINTSHPPLAVCSGDLSIIEPVSEMNVPDDPATPVIEHLNNVNFPLTSAIPPPDVSIHVSKSDNHSVEKTSDISYTQVSSSKSYERNDTTFFNYDRHQQAHANRQRVKEFDRIRREQLMKRRV